MVLTQAFQEAESAGFREGQVPDWLQHQANTRANQLAIVHPDASRTYQQLLVDALRIASVLRTFGVDEGDRVALAAKNGLIYAQVLHGIMQADAIVVPVNLRLMPSEIAWQLENADARAVVCDDENLSLLEEAVAQASVNPVIWNAERAFKDKNGIQSGVDVVTQGVNGTVENVDSRIPRTWVHPHQTHAIIYTSGTTGLPKGVQISYANHLAQATASAIQMGLSAGERWLAPMPLFHVGGMSILMRSLIYGTTVVLHDRFNPIAVNRELSEGGATLVSVVPTMLQRMLVEPSRKPYNPALRCVLLGGSAASEGLLRTCQEEGIPVAQSYGMTETNSQVAALRPEDGLRKLGSSGKPLFGTAIRIVKDGVETSPGTTGEIIVSSQAVTEGYWRRPEATAETIKDGWLHTGDVGMLDEEGYLYVLDRRRDLIVSGGENVYPAEVERVIQAMDEVVEVGVVGEHSERWGQVPVAFVVVKDGHSLTEEQVLSYCYKHLARYKVPKRLIWRAELPRNASGKLLRRRLVEWLSEL